MINLAPPSSPFVTQESPLCQSTILFTIAKPRPTPPFCLSRDSSGRKKGENIFDVLPETRPHHHLIRISEYFFCLTICISSVLIA
jgi:hypothetical protein